MAKKKTAPPPAEPVKDKKKKNQTPEPEGPQKPQRGLAIGDNFGWTGKLPATLLFEFCQKQKWNKVIMDMKKTSKGFIGIADLSWENPKTKEVIHIRMMPDTETLPPRETTNEARHFAATYAMHRINYVKNLRMVLPTIFRDYWSDLEKKRQELLKKNKTEHDKLYNANPFQVYLDEQAARAKQAKEREAKMNNEAKINKPKASISIGKVTKKPENPRTKIIQKNAFARIGRKAWENAPFIDFPVEIRRSIEEQIRHHITWTREDVSPESQKQWTQQFESLGFRPSHIEEAFSYTHTFTDALEWLLFHIPDDDLPVFFAKRDEDSSVSLKISKDIKSEYLLQRLGESGLDKDEVVAVLQECKGDERAAAVALTHRIIDYEPQEGLLEMALETWVSEIDGIDMIGSNKMKFHNDEKTVVSVDLNVKGIQAGLLLVKLYMSDGYPNVLPGVQITVNTSSFKLANYIKLSIIRQLLQHVLENGLLGECFLYFMVEWLEANIPRVIENPGSLTAAMPQLAITTIEESKKVKKTKKTTKTMLLQQDLDQIEKSYRARQDLAELRSSLEKRALLPAWQKREQLISIINSNKVTIVTGETGSGKSTQIVQFILDDLCSRGQFGSSLICTQPRRISTIGLAERISEERAGQVGDEVGYIIRGENKTKKTTRLSFVTTGVLLRMLQGFLANEGSSLFENLEYIFIDEVHERSVDSDFLLIILKKVMNKFPKLKIVLMSATINTDSFQKFFGVPVNHIHIEGRTFPIEDVYLDTILSDLDYSVTNYDGQVIRPKADSHFFKTGTANYDLIAKLCAHIDEKLLAERNKGSILVFLPGILEISKCIQRIELVFGDRNVWCLPLHSTLSLKDQTRVFKTPPAGTRKIVVSTNIAETSITIPDCVAVVDSGRGKSVHFDAQANTSRLVESWCSRAEMKQRRGRSGRIQRGTCYHLYTQQTEQSVLAQPIPEIKRVRLENLYLVVKAMGIRNVEEFLNSGLDPPEMSSLKKAQMMLAEMGALTVNTTEELTHLGRYLSFIPTDLQSGKLLILGCIFGCVEICLTLAAISSSGLPFINKVDVGDAVRQAKARIGQNQGDLIAAALAYHEYDELPREKRKKYIADNYLSYMTLQDIGSTRSQYLLILKEIGFVPFGYRKPQNETKSNFQLIRAIITGAFSLQLSRVQLPDPKYAQTLGGAVEMDPDARQTKFWIRNEKYIDQITNDSGNDELPASRVFIHPSSVIFNSSAGASLPNIEELTLEDGTIDLDKARSLTTSNTKAVHKSPFVVYNSSSFTSKHYLRDVTPTSTIAALLFGGDIAYDISSHVASGNKCPGIVLDRWQPIRTWCKNGVLIKRLRILLDQVIEHRLSNPNAGVASDDQAILNVVTAIL